MFLIYVQSRLGLNYQDRCSVRKVLGYLREGTGHKTNKKRSG